MNLYCSLTLNFDLTCVGEGGGVDAGTLVPVEPSLKYHPGNVEVLTLSRDPGRGPCLVGSLTGAVSS